MVYCIMAFVVLEILLGCFIGKLIAHGQRKSSPTIPPRERE